jgi:DNA-binding IclR family transcriptional regulator
MVPGADVVRLTDRMGRDYTTVSRQMARLEELGLVKRRVSTDVAREEIALTPFEGWSHRDFDELVRLMRILADRLNETPGGQVE